MRASRSIAWLTALVLIAAATATWIIWHSYYRYNEIQQRRVENFLYHDTYLEQCQPNQVVMLWALPVGWRSSLTVDLDRKTMFGGATNGVSISAPYPHAQPDENPLTDEQVAQLRQLLTQLPEGIDVSEENSDFSHDFRIAYFQNGTRHIRHYSVKQLPPAIISIGQTLQLWMPD